MGLVKATLGDIGGSTWYTISYHSPFSLSEVKRNSRRNKDRGYNDKDERIFLKLTSRQKRLDKTQNSATEERHNQWIPPLVVRQDVHYHEISRQVYDRHHRVINVLVPL